MKTIDTINPVTGEFQVITPKNAYWVKLYKGVIHDCAPDLRSAYLDVHVRYLLKFLEKTQGGVKIKKIERETSATY